jgi:hypothetical protein
MAPADSEQLNRSDMQSRHTQDQHRREPAEATTPCSTHNPAGGDAERQYMRALERANEVRIARAELKRSVAAGSVDVADVVINCPWEAQSMAVADLLTSQRRWGQTRCRKLLARVPMSERKTLGSMTERQRATLVSLLADAGACDAAKLRRTATPVGAPTARPGSWGQPHPLDALTAGA